MVNAPLSSEQILFNKRLKRSALIVGSQIKSVRVPDSVWGRQLKYSTAVCVEPEAWYLKQLKKLEKFVFWMITKLSLILTTGTVHLQGVGKSREVGATNDRRAEVVAVEVELAGARGHGRRHGVEAAARAVDRPARLLAETTRRAPASDVTRHRRRHDNDHDAHDDVAVHRVHVVVDGGRGNVRSSIDPRYCGISTSAHRPPEQRAPHALRRPRLTANLCRVSVVVTTNPTSFLRASS